MVSADPSDGGLAADAECRELVAVLSDPALAGGGPSGDADPRRQLLGLGGSLFVAGMHVQVVTSAFNAPGEEIGDVIYVR